MRTEEDYYAESIEISLNDLGIPNVLTKEQIAHIANGIAGSVENKSLAFHSPENPMSHEVHELKAKIARIEQEGERDSMAYKKWIAGQYPKVDTSIFIRDGRVEVEARR